MPKDKDFRVTSKQAQRAIQDAWNALRGHEPTPEKLLWELENLYKKAFVDGVEYANADTALEALARTGALE